MRTEQQALKVSLAAILVFAALGIGFGLISGSYAIIFDGVFSLVDAVVSLVSIVVSGLIVKSTSNGLSVGIQRRFTMGFWHFEPMVLATSALLMMSIAAYALIQSVMAILSGGRDIEFGPAIVYSVIILAMTTTVGLWEHRANKHIGSALVAMDVKGWLMAGCITAALLVAFVIGMLLDGTGAEWLMPYVDPSVLALVSLGLLPVPASTLRRAVADLALVTPDGMREQAEAQAAKVVEAEGFLDYRAYVAQVGRAKQFELIFHVPADMPPKPLEDWDRIRSDVQLALGSQDPNNWISVMFTTRAAALR